MPMHLGFGLTSNIPEYSSYNIKAFAVEPNYNGSWGTVTETVGYNSLRGPGFF